MKITKKIALAFTSVLIMSSTIHADDKSDIETLKQQIKELQEMTQTLTDETSDLKTGFNYTTVDETKAYKGLGPAASKVYYSKSPLSIGGYGEMYISNTNKADGTSAAETQVKRFITYFGYKFSDNIILNTEIEYEGGGVDHNGGGDEVIVEFMYLDFLVNKSFNMRLGNMLVPMGLINEQHEPTLYTTVQRPRTSYYLIPSTWHESGLMAYGNIIDGLEYKAALITALQPNDAGGDKWLRKGRGGSFKVEQPKPAGVLRVDYTGLNGLLAGASVYSDADILMWDTHVDYKKSGARLYGTYTQTSRSGTTGTQVKEANGGYVNASFDILSLTSMDNKLPIFVQYEKLSPQAKRADGTSGDATQNISIGVNFFPHPQVVLKADYVLAETNNQTDKIASFSMGFIF